MIEREYHVAFLKPSPFDLLLLRKKLTVTGTNGNTQGVSTAKRPVTRQSKKVDHKELFVACDEADVVASIAFILTEKLSSPVGNSLPNPASHVTVPFILTLSFAAR